MDATRVLGNNIILLLKDKQKTIQDFAEILGYTTEEVRKLCDGRLYVTEEDIQDIAKYFQVETEDLLIYRETKYVGDGFLHCMGKFKEEKNKEKILDIFDMYADIKEAIMQEATSL